MPMTGLPSNQVQVLKLVGASFRRGGALYFVCRRQRENLAYLINIIAENLANLIKNVYLCSSK